MTLSNRHRRTLERVFARPTPADIRWAELESLLRALGVEIRQGAGSRMQLRMGRRRMLTVHRPHGASELKRETIRDVADFLHSSGVVP